MEDSETQNQMSHPSLQIKLKQFTSACYGFPLPFHLIAFELIPMLLTKIPTPEDMRTFIENPLDGKSSTAYLLLEDIYEVEAHKQHIQVITSMIWRQRGSVIIKERAAFLDTHFISLLSGKYQLLMDSKDKATIPWGSNLKSFVLGKSTGRGLKSEFLKHVDILYVAMNWNNSHWVGLTINLQLRHVEILDPYIKHTTPRDAEKLITPVVVCMPWLLKACLPSLKNADVDTSPYTWSRTEGIYQNLRTGDCGPVALKFLEIYAFGWGVEEMFAIDDQAVDDFRKKYATDCYEAYGQTGDKRAINF